MSEISSKAARVTAEVKKVIVGKDDVIDIIMTTIIAGGHILIEDTPGVGKTTMALAFSKALGIEQKRVQFTPDVMPADLTGFSIYNKETNSFVYQPGAIICNLFLADEINRTSPKTQSALLEVMEEGTVTVDGVTRKVGEPFIVFATENPEGTAGTQFLPESQLDRFMICVSMGYPTVSEEVEIMKRKQKGNLLDNVQCIMDGNTIIEMQKEAQSVFIHDAVFEYMAKLSKATREHNMLSAGISPRATVALASMSRAIAWLNEREYILPEDVKKVFCYVAGHRVQLSTKAKVARVSSMEILEQILEQVEAPNIRKA